MKNLKRYRTLFVLAAVLLCICIPVVANAYTIKYLDGFGGTFAVFNNVNEGDAMPYPEQSPSRDDYTYDGWDPFPPNTVTGDATFVAKWRSSQSTGVVVYTVVYEDGFGNNLQVYPGLTSGSATPAYNGTPTHAGYIFTGWDREIAETVTGYTVYTAQWEVDPNYQPPEVYYPNYDVEPEPTPTADADAADGDVSPKTGATEVSLPALVIVALAAAALMVRALRKRSA
ncbi:MAG: InlB B-repeat-containing protein [Candidatus Spyradocola sp.]